MRKHATFVYAFPCLLAVASCSAPPKLASVDEAFRRPANEPDAVQLQTCTNDLHNERLRTAQAGRLAQSNADLLAQLAARQQSLAQALAVAARQEPSGNRVFTVLFATGSASVALPPAQGRAVVEAAMAAPMIMLRGRTDGNSDTPGEAHIARTRAANVRDYLIAAGVDPRRIRTTYQPTGDHAADNGNAAGRAMNRRVEIELYRALPVPLGTAPDHQP